MRSLIAVFLTLCLASLVVADLPVHCEYSQVHGTWTFSLTDDGKDNTAPRVCAYDKALPFPVTSTKNIEIQGPNIATDHETGARGTWTLIYDQGFEITLEGRKYFAFFNYTKDGTKVISNCDRTTTGWFHEAAVKPKNWGCFSAAKSSNNENVNVYEMPVKTVQVDAVFKNDEDLIAAINAEQKSWVAGPSAFEGMKMTDLSRITGKKSLKFKREAHRRTVQSLRSSAPVVNDLPENFDWRNKSMVSPVRNQQSCGSCFAFASMAMFESRVRVASGGRLQPVFSPQDDIACDPYNQGCSGGFTYSVSKYGQDYGVAPESCNPYIGRNTPCDKTCTDRTFMSDYEYIGGYYGACTEEAMMEAIYTHGPIAVDFMVYRDFFYYKGGIYHHTAAGKAAAQNNPDPHFEETNHAVLAVGWGVSSSGEKYWIVKNSWGVSWGLEGYFMIRRGTDECDIESSAVQAFPIVN